MLEKSDVLGMYGWKNSLGTKTGTSEARLNFKVAILRESGISSFTVIAKVQ